MTMKRIKTKKNQETKMETQTNSQSKFRQIETKTKEHTHTHIPIHKQKQNKQQQQSTDDYLMSKNYFNQLTTKLTKTENKTKSECQVRNKENKTNKYDEKKTKQ